MQSIIKNEFNEHIETSKKTMEACINDIEIAANICINSLKNGNKILIFGNGGSSAISSHFSVDLTKNTNIRCLNLNEHSLITCFSNDYGYEKWVEKSIDFYGDKGDILIIISASGKSKNILNGVKAAKKKRFFKNNYSFRIQKK